MNLLREYVRKLLAEAAKTVEDITSSNVYVTVKSVDDGTGILIYYSGKEGLIEPTLDNPDIPYGEVSIISSKSFRQFECDDAWEIEHSEADKGWGPLLYDIAMEFATLKGGGLASDRISVSPQARNVWNYYLNNRSDVTSQQLDKQANEPIPGPQLTPDITTDDCKQASSSKDTGRDKWFDSPLSKKYTKKPVTINALRNAGRLIEK